MAILGDLFGAGGIANLAGKVVDIVKGRVPDVNEQAKLRAELELELSKQDFQLQQGQIEINKIEAASPHWFVAGWRPAVGWLCCFILGVMYVPKALVLCAFWGVQAYSAVSGQQVALHPLPDFPDLGAGEIIGLLLAMLGIGGMRTLEKIKGADTKAMKRTDKK